MPFSFTPVHIVGVALLVLGALVTFALARPLSRRFGREEIAFKSAGLLLVAVGVALIMAF